MDAAVAPGSDDDGEQGLDSGGRLLCLAKGRSDAGSDRDPHPVANEATASADRESTRAANAASRGDGPDLTTGIHARRKLGTG